MSLSGVSYIEHEVPRGPIMRRLIRAFMNLLGVEGAPVDEIQTVARDLGIPENLVQNKDSLKNVIIREQ